MAYVKKTRRLDPATAHGKAVTSGARSGPENQSKDTKLYRRKERMLALYTQGYSVRDLCQMVGVSEATWKYYKATDEWFKAETQMVTDRRGRAKQQLPADISFEDFSIKYLKQKLFRHQLQWVDLIEGREPRDVHPSQRYEKGDPDFIVVNTPPGHGKSTTLTMNYVAYKIVTQPAFRVVIVSKTETMAKKFLQGVKRRLTSLYYRELIRDYAPVEGFEAAADMWSNSMIYLPHDEGGEKDPTVQALGIGQQIYGARADLIILDDCEDLRNVNEVEKHVEWVQQEVMTRDAPIICIGTRVGSIDMYTELLNPKRYEDDESIWTYLSQPVLLETAENPKDWVTLWPKSNQPHSRNPGEQDEDGLWPKWTGERLNKLRKGMSPRMWSLVYMQAKVDEDAIFPQEAVTGCQNRARHVGPLYNNPQMGLEYDLGRHFVIAGLDPASAAGFTAIVVLSVDKDSGKRYVLDVKNAQLTPERMRTLIREVTERYGVNEWRVERNSFQSFLTQDREINQYMAARGVRFSEHQTTGNKWDPAWGVASMSGLFHGWQDGHAMIELPGNKTTEGVRTFIEQLVTWHPDHPKTQRTDTVMALWFAEIRAREVSIVDRRQDFAQNDFLSENDEFDRVVINIDDYLREQRMLA